LVVAQIREIELFCFPARAVEEKYTTDRSALNARRIAARVV
jgi:hypothetical protein